MSAFTTEDLYINSSTLRSMFNSCNHVEPMPYPGKDTETGYYVLASNSQYKNGERIVANEMPTKLDDWDRLFESDVLYRMKDDKDITPEIPSAPTHPLSQTFYGEQQEMCEVTVIPSIKRNLKNKNNKDVCLVDVIIPDLPGSMEEASKCNAYAGDIARCILARYMLQMAPKDIDTGRVGKFHPANAWIQKRISYRFDTDLKENKCGDKIIPAVMKNLWFLCDAVVNGTKCKIVQFSRFSYVAALANVAGFVVYIQVNCRIPLPELKGALDVITPVPWQSRCHNTSVPNKLSGRCETKQSVEYKHVCVLREKNNSGEKMEFVYGYLYMAIAEYLKANEKSRSKAREQVENDILQVIWNETQNVLRIKREFYLMEGYKQAQNIISFATMRPEVDKMTAFDKTTVAVSGLVLYGLIVQEIATRLGKEDFAAAVQRAAKQEQSQAPLVLDFVKLRNALDKIGKNVSARRSLLIDVIPNIYRNEEEVLRELLHAWQGRKKMLEEYSGDLKNVVKSVQSNYFYTSPALDKSLSMIMRNVESLRKRIASYINRNLTTNRLEEELWMEQLLQNTFSSSDIANNIIAVTSQ